MDQQTIAVASNLTGGSSVQDLFALSDEQILEIEPEAEAAGQQVSVAPAERLPASANGNAGTPAAASATSHQPPVTSHQSTDQGTSAQPQLDVPLEPPAWLAAQMKDAWGGEEAREFWDGVQQARSEAAAYRAAFASPEDARALKELYPGGVTEARAAAERGRLLEEIDHAYFGAVGNSPEQTGASRAQLAQRMLREDPTAFREMVEAGIRVLQEAAGPQSRRTKSLASVVLLCHYNGTRPPPQLLVHETTRTSRRTPRSSAPRMKTWSAASAARLSARWRKRCRPVSEDIRPGKPGRSMLRPYANASPHPYART